MFLFIPFILLLILFSELLLSLAASLCCYFLLQKPVGLQTAVKWKNPSTYQKSSSEVLFFKFQIFQAV